MCVYRVIRENSFYKRAISFCSLVIFVEIHKENIKNHYHQRLEDKEMRWQIVVRLETGQCHVETPSKFYLMPRIMSKL